MTLADFSKAAVLTCLTSGFLLQAADDATTSKIRRFTIGVHVIYLPEIQMKTGTAEVVTNDTNPVAQYNYTASSTSPKWGPGAVVEYRLTPHWSVGGEIHFHHVDYQLNGEILTGINTSTTGGDNRPITTTSSQSQANFYEFPLVAHYYGFWSHGWKRRIFATGGVELRHVGRIRTGNDFIFPSGVTDYNENPATPSKVNDFGGVVGVGMRFIDEFHIRLTPEARFIRWQSPTLQGPGFTSVVNQLEAGLSLTF